jgi:protein DGCR14
LAPSWSCCKFALYFSESKSDTAGSSNLNIDKFLSKYTSEDNASFEELTALNAKRERIRLAWMYKAEEEHNRLRVTQSEALRPADEQLALPSTQPRPCDLDNWTYKARLVSTGLLVLPAQILSDQHLHICIDDLVISMFCFRNSVLFDPTDAVLTVEEHIQRQKMNQRVINRDATRFTQNPFQESLKQTTMNKAALLHAASMKGNIDVSGEVAGFRHPGQLFSFVATPSPAPGLLTV